MHLQNYSIMKVIIEDHVFKNTFYVVKIPVRARALGNRSTIKSKHKFLFALVRALEKSHIPRLRSTDS